MNNGNHSLPFGGGSGRGATTPYYLIDADAIRHNLEILRGVMDRTGAHILLAQKAFSCYALYPMIGEYLSGATASGLFEARLCHEEMVSSAKCKIQSAKLGMENYDDVLDSNSAVKNTPHSALCTLHSPLENHIFSPAFREEDMDEIVSICDHIVFNSIRQLELYGKKAMEHGCQVGLRINPECSTQPAEHAIYDPCAPGSRLGVNVEEFRKWVKTPKAIELLKHLPLEEEGRGLGLHFHTLCEQDSDALEQTIDAVVEKFGEWLPQMKWINFGGGHHITRPDYDIPRLERCIKKMQNDFGLEVYIEPGEAIALNAGTLHTTVLEVQPKAKDGIANIILDTSAACHMPDVIEMPYTPPLQGAKAVEKGDNFQFSILNSQFIYRLAGPTCLSGDIIGTYCFNHELHEGDELVFKDMAIYSMVKNNTFNGMPLPSIYIKEGEEIRLWKTFGYQDFKMRI